jgi:hypothetical protein
MTDKPLPEALRKEIFLALAEAQGQGMSPAASRELVAGRFGVSEGRVRKVEREGLDKDWPPL